MLTNLTESSQEQDAQWTFSNGEVFLLCLASYALLAQSTHLLNNPVSLGANFWPASGFTIAALLLSPLRQWGWILLAAGIAEFGSNTYYQYPLAASLLWTAGNCVEPLVGALLVRTLAIILTGP
jgi:integral membrane sensor domain MASE1